jgi:hypothetical protein
MISFGESLIGALFRVLLAGTGTGTGADDDADPLLAAILLLVMSFIEVVLGVMDPSI